MKWFRDLRIEVKFIGAFVIVASISMAVGFIGIRNMSQIDEMADQIYTKELMGLSYVKEANIELINLARAEKNIILAPSDETRQAFIDQSNKNEMAYLQNLEKAKALFYTEKGKELFARVEKGFGEYNSVRKQVVELVKKEGLAEKKASTDLSMGLSREKINVLDGILSELTAAKEENAKRLADNTTETYQSARNFMLALSVLGFLVGLAFGIVLTLSVTQPLKRIIEGLSRGAEQVASASDQVSSSSQQLAEGTSEQASSLEETSSSLEEMSSMTRQNAENAQQGQNLMNQTAEIVDQANVSMSNLTVSMEEISKRSQETQKVVKTIEEIAFQTNLLALNAAVEAARAGEAGAGFAVVADEVRNLAIRAAQAAKDTASLIEASVKKITEGSNTVVKTNDDFKQVATSAKKVKELVHEIAAASKEQAQGIEQVNRAVAEMDKVVQSNAASAEESASAAEELNAQAKQMEEFVMDLAGLVSKQSRLNESHVSGNNAAHTNHKKTPNKTLKFTTDRKTLKRPVKAEALKSDDQESKTEQVTIIDDKEVINF